MKRVLAWCVYALLFIVALMVFVPKKSLYYLVERELQKEHIVIDNEVLEEKLFGLEIEHGEIYVSGVQVAKIMSTSLKPYLVYNAMELEGVRISGVAKSFLPTRIEHATLSYVVWHPTRMKIVADGEFGHLTGVVELKKRVFLMHLSPTKSFVEKYSSLLRRMKKAKKGEYIYERRF